MKVFLVAVAAALALSGAAQAEGFNIEAGGTLIYSFDRNHSPLSPEIPHPDAARTDTKDGNALEGAAYLEAQYSGLYGGVRGFVARETDLSRADLYLGYRGETGQGFAYDVSYTRYFYPKSGGNCCGQIALDVGVPVGARGTGKVDVALDPENSEFAAGLGLDYAVTDQIAVGVGYGIYDLDISSTERQWKVGASYAVNDRIKTGVTWKDGSAQDGFLALTVDFKTSLLSR